MPPSPLQWKVVFDSSGPSEMILLSIQKTHFLVGKKVEHPLLHQTNETVRNEIYDNFLSTCYSATMSIYAVASHRSFDNYYARFVGFATGLEEIQTAFPAIAKQLAALDHNKTLTFRRSYVDHRTPDEFVVLRYDVPANADHLHVQFIKWKYAGLTISATTGDKPAIPKDVDMLSDCVYNASWSRPVKKLTSTTIIPSHPLQDETYDSSLL